MTVHADVQDMRHSSLRHITRTWLWRITGMAKDKAMKKDYVNTRWLPAVNSVRGKYGYDEWRFIEIANDIRDIKNQLVAAVEGAVTA